MIVRPQQLRELMQILVPAEQRPFVQQLQSALEAIIPQLTIPDGMLTLYQAPSYDQNQRTAYESPGLKPKEHA